MRRRCRANHTATYSYADNYAAGTGTPPGQTNGYLTQVTLPNTGIAHTVGFSWGYNDGQIRSSTDQNGQTASYQFNDPLARLTQIAYPDTGQTTVAYNDSTFSSSAHTPNFVVTKTITASLSLSTTNAMDGMGHSVTGLLTTDPDGTDTTDTTYDGLGRVRTKSNPHRSASSLTDGSSTTSYDPLGRVVSVLQPDGSTVTTSYSGQCTTVTDEAGKARKSCTDSLGRVVQVFEDPSGLNYETDYAYDTLDNILSATQKGGTTNTSLWRTRTFTYDFLSRLLTANNPESGTIIYNYHANGNVSSRVAPLPNQTGTTTVTTSYLYDSLNRLTQKSYTDGTTALVKFGYDGVALSGCTTSPPSLTDTYPKGERTAMCDAFRRDLMEP